MNFDFVSERLAEVEARLHSRNEKPVSKTYHLNPNQSTIQALNQRKTVCEFRIYIQRRKLERMCAAHDINSRIYRSLKLLHDEGCGSVEPWILQRKSSAESKMNVSAPCFQQSLEVEIKVLSAEIETIVTLLMEFKNHTQ